ncbi:gibberellin cluster-C13-oxidase [Fusarium denticulatum]|uniref:Gibberellin cluster-C13-oxidase n=1 Tax=Fusarium denticulatum TaxID=48507 RepID=A0A8H5WH81_9HYPO|nr:gibberellin cluster-C13-oxidase [Fusarium denticulatum]
MMNTSIKMIELLELAGLRALRIVVGFAVLWSTAGLLALTWWIYKQLFKERVIPHPVVGDPHAQSLEENLIQGMKKGKYIHITTIRPEIPATIREDLTRNMPSIMLGFQDELAYASEFWPGTSN